MALTQATTKLQITMARDTSGGRAFAFRDTTDYVGNGETLADIKTAIKIEYAGATSAYYDNIANIASDPDISGASAGQSNEDLLRARTQTIPIPLPQDGDGDFITGLYTFTYMVSNGVTDITLVTVVDTTFETPEGDLDSSVDVSLTSPSLKLIDNTNYVVQNVTPTSTPEITLYYPANVGVSPTVVSASSLEVYTFWTGQQIGELSTPAFWDYTEKVTSTDFTSPNLTITIGDTITDTEYVEVVVNNNICELFCCLNAFAKRIVAAKNSPSEYAELTDTAGLVAFYYNSIDAAYQCSKTQNVNLWVEELRDLVDCGDDCGCSDGEPVQISGITSGSGVAGTTISFVTSGVTNSYQNNTLIDYTYTATQQGFLVFADGLKATGTFVSATGTFTPTYSWASGVQIEIVSLAK